MNNYLFKYFKREASPPSPSGPLSQKMPSSMIQAANDSVSSVVSTAGDGSDGKKRGPYVKLSSEDKARIANYAVTHGTSAAIRHFQTEFPYLKWTTVNDWKTAIASLVKERTASVEASVISTRVEITCLYITKYFRIHENFITKYLIASKIRKITKVFYLESLELYGSTHLYIQLPPKTNHNKVYQNAWH